MSGIVRPKGRAGAAVYWRRRLVLLTVVLLAVAVSYQFFGGDGEEQQTAASDSDQQAAETTEQSPSGQERKQSRQGRKKTRNSRESDDSTTRDRQSGERNVPVEMGRGGEDCDPSTVTVTPQLAPDAYAGDQVTVRLGLSTVANAACVIDLKSTTPLVSISQDDQLVWDSQRCDDLLDTPQARLEPGWTTYVDARWSGRASGNRCGDNADFAQPGTYEVQSAVLGGEPKKTEVTLESPPEPSKKKGADNGENGDNAKQGDDGAQSDDKKNKNNADNDRDQQNRDSESR